MPHQQTKGFQGIENPFSFDSVNKGTTFSLAFANHLQTFMDILNK